MPSPGPFGTVSSGPLAHALPARRGYLKLVMTALCVLPSLLLASALGSDPIIPPIGASAPELLGSPAFRRASGGLAARHTAAPYGYFPVAEVALPAGPEDGLPLVFYIALPEPLPCSSAARLKAFVEDGQARLADQIAVFDQIFAPCGIRADPRAAIILEPRLPAGMPAPRKDFGAACLYDRCDPSWHLLPRDIAALAALSEPFGTPVFLLPGLSVANHERTNQGCGGCAFTALARKAVRLIFGVSLRPLILLDRADLGSTGAGHILAHELGHILFGEPSLHSPDPMNFMHARFGVPAQAGSRPTQAQCRAARRLAARLKRRTRRD